MAITVEHNGNENLFHRSNVVDQTTTTTTTTINDCNSSNKFIDDQKVIMNIRKLSSIYEYIRYRIHRRYRRNPFRSLIKFMILMNLIPMNGFEEICNRKPIDHRRSIRVIILYTVPGLLNLIRLFASLQSYDLNENDHRLGWHNILFVPLFIYGQNRYQFSLALATSFFCEFLLTYISWSIVLNPIRRYNLFIQLKQWDKIFRQTFGDSSFNESRTKQIKWNKFNRSGSIQCSFIDDREQLRSLCCLLDFFIRAIPILGIILAIFFLIIIIFDFSLGYFHYELPMIFWFTFIFFNAILLYQTFRVVSFSISWLNILLVSALLFRFQYEHVRSRMLLLKLSTPHEHRIKLLFKLNEINGKIMRFAREISIFILIFYQIYIFVNDMELVLLLDLRSEEFIRYALILVFAATFGFAIVGFSLLSRLNVYSRCMIPCLEQMIYDHNSSSHINRNKIVHIRIDPRYPYHCHLPIRLILFRLKLLETHVQLKTDMIGIRCGDIFTITRDDNFRSLLFFFVNVILISNLFQTYF
ncbi:hypothetical protein DERF_005758 [Dermatophagoides farinae]|uniref:Uncharacterized protein n=2 Tax=Dermatophagoides farinae TaxID=6954 RepID=A0A922L6X8_DERFA|nr:hypothetical protein HUG17_3314 [Dermatophagoides farinae]KAH9522159.1 hypothetical protein DERF_005758 [Dermatophagoides farinae]